MDRCTNRQTNRYTDRHIGIGWTIDKRVIRIKDIGLRQVVRQRERQELPGIGAAVLI